MLEGSSFNRTGLRPKRTKRAERAHDQIATHGAETAEWVSCCDAEGKGKPLHYSIPRTIIMAENRKIMALSPRQAVSGQRVRRISGSARRICTWNVRSMFQESKIHNTIQEMKRLKIDVMGISEMRWRGKEGKCCVSEHTVYYTGNKDPQHRNGVEVILSKEAAGAVLRVRYLSDRVLMVKLRDKPFNINIVQVYAPTTGKPDEEIEEFYDLLQKALKYIKKSELCVIMGDFNAKIGRGRVEGIVGEHGLGERNKRGDRLVQFCREEDFVIMNTWFKLPARRLYTWKSPATRRTT